MPKAGSKRKHDCHDCSGAPVITDFFKAGSSGPVSGETVVTAGPNADTENPVQESSQSPVKYGPLSKSQRRRLLKRQYKAAQKAVVDKQKASQKVVVVKPRVSKPAKPVLLKTPSGNIVLKKKNPGKAQRAAIKRKQAERAARRKQKKNLAQSAELPSVKPEEESKDWKLGTPGSSKKFGGPKTPKSRRSSIPGKQGTSPNIIEAFKRSAEVRKLSAARRDLSSALELGIVSRQVTYHSFNDDPDVEVVKVLISPQLEKSQSFSAAKGEGLLGDSPESRKRTSSETSSQGLRDVSPGTVSMNRGGHRGQWGSHVTTPVRSYYGDEVHVSFGRTEDGGSGQFGFQDYDGYGRGGRQAYRGQQGTPWQGSSSQSPPASFNMRGGSSSSSSSSSWSQGSRQYEHRGRGRGGGGGHWSQDQWPRRASQGRDDSNLSVINTSEQEPWSWTGSHHNTGDGCGRSFNRGSRSDSWDGDSRGQTFNRGRGIWQEGGRGRGSFRGRPFYRGRGTTSEAWNQKGHWHDPSYRSSRVSRDSSVSSLSDDADVALTDPSIVNLETSTSVSSSRSSEKEHQLKGRDRSETAASAQKTSQDLYQKPKLEAPQPHRVTASLPEKRVLKGSSPEKKSSIPVCNQPRTATNTPQRSKDAGKRPLIFVRLTPEKDKDKTDEKPAVNQEASEKPAGKLEASEKPAGKLEASMKPAVKQEASENSAVNQEASEKPAVKQEASENSAIKQEASEKPAVKQEASVDTSSTQQSQKDADNVPETHAQKVAAAKTDTTTAMTPDSKDPLPGKDKVGASSLLLSSNIRSRMMGLVLKSPLLKQKMQSAHVPAQSPPVKVEKAAGAGPVSAESNRSVKQEQTVPATHSIVAMETHVETDGTDLAKPEGSVAMDTDSTVPAGRTVVLETANTVVKPEGPVAVEPSEAVTMEPEDPVAMNLEDPVVMKLEGPDGPVAKTIGDNVAMKPGGPVAMKPSGPLAMKPGGPVAMEANGSVAMTPGGSVAMKQGGPVAMKQGGPVAMKQGGPVAMKPASPVAMKSCGSVAMKPCGPVAMKPSGPVAMKPSGPVAMKPGGPVAMEASGSVAMEANGSVAMKPCGPVAMKPSGPVAMKPSGPVAMKQGGPVAMKQGGPVAMKPASPVAMKSCGSVAMKPCGPVAMKPSGPVAMKPSGPVAMKPGGPVAMEASGSVAMEASGSVAMEASGPVAMEANGPVAMKPGGPVAMKPVSPVAMEAKGPVARKPGGPVAIEAKTPAAMKPGGPVAMKPGGPVAMKPGETVAMKPGGSVAMKPGGNIAMEAKGPVAMKPGETVAMKPGGSVAMKPGDPVAMKPGGPFVMEAKGPVAMKPGESVAKKPGGSIAMKPGGPVAMKPGGPVAMKPGGPVAMKPGCPVAMEAEVPVAKKPEGSVPMETAVLYPGGTVAMETERTVAKQADTSDPAGKVAMTTESSAERTVAMPSGVTAAMKSDRVVTMETDSTVAMASVGPVAMTTDNSAPSIAVERGAVAGKAEGAITPNGSSDRTKLLPVTATSPRSKAALVLARTDLRSRMLSLAQNSPILQKKMQRASGASKESPLPSPATQADSPASADVAVVEGSCAAGGEDISTQAADVAESADMEDILAIPLPPDSQEMSPVTTSKQTTGAVRTSEQAVGSLATGGLSTNVTETVSQKKAVEKAHGDRALGKAAEKAAETKHSEKVQGQVVERRDTVTGERSEDKVPDKKAPEPTKTLDKAAEKRDADKAADKNRHPVEKMTAVDLKNKPGEGTMEAESKAAEVTSPAKHDKAEEVDARSVLEKLEDLQQALEGTVKDDKAKQHTTSSAASASVGQEEHVESQRKKPHMQLHDSMQDDSLLDFDDIVCSSDSDDSLQEVDYIIPASHRSPARRRTLRIQSDSDDDDNVEDNKYPDDAELAPTHSPLQHVQRESSFVPKPQFSIDSLLQERRAKKEEKQELDCINNELNEGLEQGGLAHLVKVIEEENAPGQDGLLPEHEVQLRRLEVNKRAIQDYHPGQVVFDPRLYQGLFSYPDTLTLAACGFTPGNGYMDRYLASAEGGPEMLVEFLTSNVVQLCFETTASPNQLLSWAFYLMSVHTSSLLVHRIYGLLYELLHRQKGKATAWVPTVFHVARVFVNYGTRLGDMICPGCYTSFTEADLSLKEDNKENSPAELNRAVAAHQPMDVDMPANTPGYRKENLQFVIRTLTVAVTERYSKYSSDDLVALIVMVMKTSLDENLNMDVWKCDFEVCLAALLNAFKPSDWADDILELCVLLPRCAGVNAHHHDLLHMTQILPTVERGRYLQRHLAYRFMQQLLGFNISSKQLLDYKVADLVSVPAHMQLGQDADFYLASSLIGFLDCAVGNETLRSAEKESLRNLMESLKHRIGEIKEYVNALDRTMVKDMMVRLTSKWSFMLQNMASTQKSLFAYARHMGSSSKVSVEEVVGSQTDSEAEQSDHGSTTDQAEDMVKM